MKRSQDQQGGGTSALTPQREAVLQAIRESDGHLTAGEVFEAARRRLPSISYATVYNSLNYLKDTGLISEINFGNGASRYDRETERHDHAICTECGTLVDFDIAVTPEVVRAAARKTGFRPESLHLTLRGVCPDCRD